MPSRILRTTVIPLQGKHEAAPSRLLRDLITTLGGRHEAAPSRQLITSFGGVAADGEPLVAVSLPGLLPFGEDARGLGMVAYIKQLAMQVKYKDWAIPVKHRRNDYDEQQPPPDSSPP